MKVALLGAAGTGKSWLARALTRHWPEHVFLDGPGLDSATMAGATIRTHGANRADGADETHGAQVASEPHVAHWDRVLLMGLDWPAANQLAAAAQASRRAEDARLRAWLNQTQRAYGVVYGQGPQRLRAAMQLLFPQDIPTHLSQGRWRGPCEKCADPDCEFRLFSALTAQAPGATAPSRSMAADRPPG
jgi:hypothetical protein